MKALDEYFLMVVLTLLLNGLRVFASFGFVLCLDTETGRNISGSFN